jgi:BirA family biotin operon repressor/biotin-[acetyl-CoA-carboxylase] ligase
VASGEWRAASLDALLERTFLCGVEHHTVIASTNDRALELCAVAELPLPHLVIADHQTGGRGRGANRWWSSDGAVQFSLIVDAVGLGLPESRWPLVSLTTGVAVCETIAHHSTGTVGLKWPNDVWLNERKVCGILVEVPATLRGRLVIGVGLNVNNSFAAAPAELQSIATSMRDEAGEKLDRSTLMVGLLQAIDQHLQRLALRESSLTQRWQQLDVLRDRTVSLQTSQQVIIGRCLGLGDDGALRLETPRGEQSFYGGTVCHIE